MASILLRKTLAGKLEPVDEAGRDVLARVAAGNILRAEIKRPRNLGHHRKFFALIGLIFENQTRYKSQEELLDAIKVYCGHCSTMVLRNGDVVKVPKSISFAALDQTAFEDFWNRVVAVVCEHILPGVKQDDLEREIRELVA